jgi:pimeloyl-ACP methyl ester carboxylesterase
LIKMIKLYNNSEIEVGLTGNLHNKTIMLPIAKKSVYGKDAENLKLWGVDPELGKNFVEGLADQFQVLYFDYEGHLFNHPNPDDLTPERIVNDFLLIADEMNVRNFSYYGYSWLALVGLQLAIRTNRLDSLIMGGFPPYEGPYREMMVVTQKTYEQAQHNQLEPVTSNIEPWNPEDIDWDHIPVTIDPAVTKQFVTMYSSLLNFDDRRIHDQLSVPRLTFAGEKDTIVYGENFGSVTVDIVGLLEKSRSHLESLGWDVELIRGSDMDHTKAMQPAWVLPLIKPWFMKQLL